MLIKKSQKNQVAIPKAVLERAGLDSDDVYFDCGYENGRIVLIPLHIEEKIPAEALERFETRMSKRGRGDRVARSMTEVIKGLHRKRRR